MQLPHRILIVGDCQADIARLGNDLLAAGDRSLTVEYADPETAAGHARAGNFDVLLLLGDGRAARALALEPWLCELTLTGPQPLLVLRDRVPGDDVLPALSSAEAATDQLGIAIDAAIRRRQALRERLRGEIAHALVRGEMELRYQPVLDVQRRRLDRVEVLLRWRHPLYGLMGPEHFLELAEAGGAIHPLGLWTLRHAREQQEQWQQQGLPLIPLSINVADSQLEKLVFAQAIDDHLADTPTGALGLEISAASLERSSGEIRRRLARWHRNGIHLTADHIGDSQRAAPLQGLPLDALKLDRHLISRCERYPARASALKALLELGQSLGCDTIAAGVESRQTAHFLHDQHCDHLQGFCVSRPLTGAEVGNWVRTLTQVH